VTRDWPSCGREFRAVLPGEGALCRVCWAERQGDIDLALADLAWEKGHELGYERGHADTLEAGLFSPEALRHLVELCHPDRHPPERLELANEVTAWLLELRGIVGQKGEA
jgi:hypothetical protein